MLLRLRQQQHDKCVYCDPFNHLVCDKKMTFVDMGLEVGDPHRASPEHLVEVIDEVSQNYDNDNVILICQMHQSSRNGRMLGEVKRRKYA